MSKESIQGPLTALRNAGTVCGVSLVRGTEIVVNLFPFSQERITEVVTLIDDIVGYLANQGREIDQLCFGYDGGNLVIVTDEDFRLIVMHMHPDEIDFIAKAARAFLVDFQVGLFAEQLSGGNPRLTGTGMTRELPPVVIPGEEPKPDSVVPKGQPVAGAASVSAPAEPQRPRVIQSPGMEENAAAAPETGEDEDNSENALPPRRDDANS